jgi:hypothetical protein
MKTLPVLALIAACAVWTPAAQAEGAAAAPRVDHYQARQADDIAQTIANLREANQQLEAILAGEVGEYDMHDVHSLSYTIEDSLARLSEHLLEMKDIAGDMHFASEGLKRDDVIEHAKAYLSGVRKIID